MCKINVKKSILEIVEKNNLEILKIDLYNDVDRVGIEMSRNRMSYS